MNSEFQSFVEKIVKQMDGNHEEKADLQEELMIHLELSKAEFIKNGCDKEEAEEKAMTNFGNANDVGNQIQHAMFPFRKAMLVTLAIASIVYSIIVYLTQLFIEGDAHIVWLVLSITISSILLLFALQVVPSLDRKRWLNASLISHIFVYLLGTTFAPEPGTHILAWLLILLSITLIYRTAIYDNYSGQPVVKKQMKRLHFLNISVGIVVIIVTLFQLWAFLLLGFPPDKKYIFFLILTPLLIWIVAYVAQMKLAFKNKRKLAYLLATIPVILFLGVIVMAFQIFFVV